MADDNEFYTLDAASIDLIRRMVHRLVTQFFNQQMGQFVPTFGTETNFYPAKVKDETTIPARDTDDDTTDIGDTQPLRRYDTDAFDTVTGGEEAVISARSMSPMEMPQKTKGMLLKEPFGDWLFQPFIHMEHVKLTEDLAAGSPAAGTIWRRIDDTFSDTEVEVSVRCELLSTGTIPSGSLTACVVLPDGFAYVIAAQC